jgi:hypothetical protein
LNINTAKIKYIIAREGLIIISLLICMAVSLYLDSWKADKIGNYVNDAKDIELINSKSFIDPDDREGEKLHIVPGIKTQFPKSTSIDLIKRAMDRDYPNHGPGEWIDWDKTDNTNISARYDDKGNKLFIGFPWNIDFKNRVTLFLFFAYPAYLLIRFIVWSILTVKENKKEGITS